MFGENFKINNKSIKIYIFHKSKILHFVFFVLFFYFDVFFIFRFGSKFPYYIFIDIYKNGRWGTQLFFCRATHEIWDDGEDFFFKKNTREDVSQH